MEENMMELNDLIKLNHQITENLEAVAESCTNYSQCLVEIFMDTKTMDSVVQLKGDPFSLVASIRTAIFFLAQQQNILSEEEILKMLVEISD